MSIYLRTAELKLICYLFINQEKFIDNNYKKPNVTRILKMHVSVFYGYNLYHSTCLTVKVHKVCQ